MFILAAPPDMSRKMFLGQKSLTGNSSFWRTASPGTAKIGRDTKTGRTRMRVSNDSFE
jgi:hypothetical protein